MDAKLDKKFQKYLNSKVEEYTNDGTSLPQAVSIVAKSLGLNPYKIMQKYYPDVDNSENISYNDNKTEEGSFVTLKNDSDENQYEVININNKDAIVLRNTNNNEEIIASENEITPVITENRMVKINEAQYSVSINGLETQDAATLSQIFDLAGQAESSDTLASSPMGDVTVNPTPMDIDSGMPMDMDDAMTTDAVIDDVEFDEELPTDTTPMDTSSIGGFNPDEYGVEPSIDEPTIDEPVMDEPTEPFGEEPIEDMSVDTMMDDGMFDDEIAETLKWAGVELNEAEEIIPGNKFIDDEGQVKGRQEEFAEDIVDENTVNQAINAGEDVDMSEPSDGEILDENGEDTDFDNEIAEALRIAGVQLDESEDTILELDEEKEDDFPEGGDYNHLTYYEGKVDEFMADYFYDNAELQSEFNNNMLDMYKEEIYNKWKDLVENGEDDWKAAEKAAFSVFSNTNDDFDDEISEVLKNAGVQLDEEILVNAPKERITKPVKKEKTEKSQTPNYKKVDTDTFGKESSEGHKCSITCESTVNKDKIKSIYETAKSMYAKKDISEWEKLDRRYIEKLIKEGCSYSTSSKMLQEAKKGK